MALMELVQFIAMELVDHPNQVAVEEIESPHQTVIELRVAKDDIGKVIGRDGKTAQSIRTLLSAASAKIGKKAHLDIVG